MHIIFPFIYPTADQLLRILAYPMISGGLVDPSIGMPKVGRMGRMVETHGVLEMMVLILRRHRATIRLANRLPMPVVRIY